MLSLIQGHPELEAKNIGLLARGVEETLTFHLWGERASWMDGG